ncbi:MAG: hypothetical protein IJ137_05765 [Eubacterium sp.]|nr:hypothetical protein [Eubacterium sp.]
MKHRFLKKEDKVYRILEETEEELFIVSCERQEMPCWITKEGIPFEDETLYAFDGSLTTDQKKVMRQRYTVIADILPVMTDKKERSVRIRRAEEEYGISKQTIRRYLWRYLVYQDIRILAPEQSAKKELTQDQKNIRWALNKYYYNRMKLSLISAYRLMLKEKYTNEEGNLVEGYPSFAQFRYFYRKTRKLQNQYISRNGLSYYQRNQRPCVGDGVQEFANHTGVFMLDSTVCDIYLVNEQGQVVGRPTLTASVDAYSTLCTGYSLTWEGGVYSLKKLMLHVISDKVSHCRKHGINIIEDQWPGRELPGKILTDMGAEYASETFAQIAELGITVVNLPPFRPELKPEVEKFFDVIQGYYKPYLKGKGVVEPDYQERGGHDYRKDACLTLEEFERVILHCIIYYNSRRILENFPYTEQMLTNRLPPFACEIWMSDVEEGNADLIEVDEEELLLTLLPRVKGTFTEAGL